MQNIFVGNEKRMNQPWVGGIEAGGTKFVCAVGSGPEDVRQPGNRVVFPTGGDPTALLAEVTTWFLAQQVERGEPLAALGVASFGPVDLDPTSPTYGYITSTPKPGWGNTDLLGPLRDALGSDLPIGFDTDVNGAALGERMWGGAVDLDDFLYITIGTGIGAGGMARGQLLHGLVHPEIGHLRLPRVPGDTFPGVCPYHGDCWEGLCSGPAIERRTSTPAGDLPPDHPAWDLVTHSVGDAIANLVCTLSPQRILLGGSVRKAGRLGEEAFFAKVRTRVRTSLNGYVASPALTEAGIVSYLVPPALGDDAGVCGALALGLGAIPRR